MADPKTTQEEILDIDGGAINNIDELIANIAIASGVDWYNLPEVSKTQAFNSILGEISDFLVNYIGTYGHESDIRNLKIIIASKFKPEVMEKYENTLTFLDQGLKALVQRIVTDITLKSFQTDNQL